MFGFQRLLFSKQKHRATWSYVELSGLPCMFEVMWWTIGIMGGACGIEDANLMFHVGVDRGWIIRQAATAR